VRPFAFLFLMFLSASAFCQENVALGQNMVTYLKEHPPTFKSTGPAVVGIPEGTVSFYKYKAKTDSTDLKVLMVLDKYPIGVLQSVNGKPQLLQDLTGDGVLETETQSIEIPFWAVAWNTQDGQKTQTNNAKQYLDGYYQLFQGDTNPFTSGKLQQYSAALLQQVVSGSGQNRDLLYALYCCYSWGSKYPAGTAASAVYLVENYTTRFKADHPLFYLQLLESAIDAADKESAHKFLDDLLKLDPGYIPAQVYRWQLETDPDKKKAYLADLKKTHPNHWIVSQLQSK
jgi:hypothetical protein